LRNGALDDQTLTPASLQMFKRIQDTFKIKNMLN